MISESATPSEPTLQSLSIKYDKNVPDGATNPIFAALLDRSGPYPDDVRTGDTLVISLLKNGSETERYRKTSAALTAAGLPAHKRWNAVLGESLSADEKNALVGTRALYSITQGRDSVWDLISWGAVGCAMSHAAIWRHMVLNNIEWLLVLEDDAVPVDITAKVATESNSKTILQERVKAMVKRAQPARFDVLMLQHKHTFLHGGKHLLEPAWDGSPNLQRSFGMGMYAAAYVVTLRGARRLLHNVFPLDFAVDTKIYAMARLYDGKHQTRFQGVQSVQGVQGVQGDEFVLLQATTQLFKHPLLNNIKATDIGNVDWRDMPVLVPKQISLPFVLTIVLLVLALVAALIAVTVRLLKAQSSSSSSSSASSLTTLPQETSKSPLSGVGSDVV